jgi:hypothetical protein
VPQMHFLTIILTHFHCCPFLTLTGTGTSASTPTVAGIVAMLNEHRLASGKTSLGKGHAVVGKVQVLEKTDIVLFS